MAYNLRHRPLYELLVHDDEHQEVLDTASSGEEDAVEEDDDDFEPPIDSSSDEAEEELDVENASLAQRLLEVRARQNERNDVIRRGRGRGRPTSILRGKNGYKWNTRIPERESGKKFENESISFSIALGACLILFTFPPKSCYIILA